jgi:hypothetical protein
MFVLLFLTAGQIFASTEMKCTYTETNSAGERSYSQYIDLGNIDSTPKLSIPGNTNIDVNSVVETYNGKFSVSVNYTPKNDVPKQSLEAIDSQQKNQNMTAELQVADVVYRLSCVLM